MEKAEVLRFLKGQIKKHGPDFSVRMKYRTESDKIRKRHGKFVELAGEETIVLFNPDKKATGRYALERIVEIARE